MLKVWLEVIGNHFIVFDYLLGFMVSPKNEDKYCLVFDLYGFKNINRNLEEEALKERVEEWYNFISQNIKNSGFKQYSVCSDSVFIIENSNLRSLKKILDFSRLILENGLIQKFPIRGTITCGKAYLKENIIYGPAIVEAYERTEHQEWLGIIISNYYNNDKLKKATNKLWDWDNIFMYSVPWKNANEIELTPIVSWNPQMEFILKNTLEGGLIKEEKEGEIKWTWGYKMQNTIMFHLYKQIAKRHNLNPRQFYGILPIELIYYYIKYPDTSEKAFAEIMKERIVSAA